MKLLLISIVTPLLAATMLAQRPFGVLTSSSPPDPATMVQNQVTRLTSLLGLTNSQASEATTIFTNAMTAISPLRTTMSGYWSSMQTAVKAGATATIDQLASSIGATMGQITAVQNKADAAFYAILTPSQQATLNATPGALGGPGFGGPGPGGPPPGPPSGGSGQ